jgi:hypothetical protein
MTSRPTWSWRCWAPSGWARDALIRHDSESVRVLTAHALAEGRGTEVVEPLTRMLSAELERPAPTRDSTEGSRSPEVIRAVTAGLGRTG